MGGAGRGVRLKPCTHVLSGTTDALKLVPFALRAALICQQTEVGSFAASPGCFCHNFVTYSSYFLHT